MATTAKFNRGIQATGSLSFRKPRHRCSRLPPPVCSSHMAGDTMTRSAWFVIGSVLLACSLLVGYIGVLFSPPLTQFAQLRGRQYHELERLNVFDAHATVVIQNLTVPWLGQEQDGSSWQTVLAACGDTPYVETSSNIELVVVDTYHMPPEMVQKARAGEYDYALINVCPGATR